MRLSAAAPSVHDWLEPMTDEPILKTPLHALHLELGARMGPFAGYDMPIQYPAGILAEHLHTRKAAGLFDVSHMGQALIEGADHAAAARFLESLCPADFLGLAPGRQRYTQLLNDEGGIVDDLMVTRPPGADGALRLVVNAARKAVDFALISARLPAGIRLTPLPQAALIALQGPLAAPTLRRLAPGEGLDTMAFMTARPARIGDVETFVSRSGYTGEDGYEISLDSARAERFARLLLSEPDVAPIGLGARDSLRLEAGLCLYGHELDETVDPVEAGLVWSIQKRRRIEGGFPGAKRIQEALDERAGAAQGRRPSGRARAGARGDGDRLGRRRQDRNRDFGRVRAKRRRADRDGLCRERPRGGRDAGRSHRARQAARRADRRAAVSSSRLLPRLSLRRRMMPEIRYTKDHEYVRVEGAEGVVGISEHAQTQLGDVVFAETPPVGKTLKQGDAAAVVESVKAASDVFAPVSGEVVAVNSEVEATPGLINEDALGRGWLFRLKLADPGELAGLMDEQAYAGYLKTLD